MEWNYVCMKGKLWQKQQTLHLCFNLGDISQSHPRAQTLFVHVYYIIILVCAMLLENT